MKTKSKKILIASILIGMVLMSCSDGKSSKSQSNSKSDSDPKMVVSDEALAKAEQIFTTTCAACHGTGGIGDGPASKTLTPPPRDLTSPEWQNSVDDDHIAKIIQYGGAAVGKSVAMPSNPAIGADKEVLNALVVYVRSLKK